MNVTISNEAIEEGTEENGTWANASLYYSMPSSDPDLIGCQPIILKSELQVLKKCNFLETFFSNQL